MSAPTSGPKAIESAGRGSIYAVAFTADGHIFGGDNRGEIRRWRVEDAQQVGPTMKANGRVESVAVSSDGRWLVTGDDGRKGIVWNARTHEKVLQVAEHAQFVYAVDVASDSTRFATGSSDKTARIFNIATGVRLVPPLQHDSAVVGLKFSPNGDRLTTATRDVCVRIYNSRTGEKLFEAPVQVVHTPTTPFAWSADGQELFIVSPGKITCFNTSKSSSSEWLIHNNSPHASIVTSGWFVACAAGSSVSLWDLVSHEKINQVIEYGPDVFCITLSSRESLLACGQGNKISIYKFKEILPDHYLSTSPSRPAPATYPPPASPVSRPSNTSRPLPVTKNVAPSSDPVVSVDVLVKQSKAQAKHRLWKEALEDANQAIQADASCHHAYECKYVALHGTGRYDEAIEAFDSMLSLIEESGDPKIRQLCDKYISTSRRRNAVEAAVRTTFKDGPLVLIDVTTGCLCDRKVLPDLFRSDPVFKELISSMIEEIDKERIQKTVKKYFGYVMFSHVWGDGKDKEKGNEPTFKAVKSLQSIHSLPNAPMNNKLRNFCAKVVELGYRWAWSDTCCIDKSDDAVLNRSLRSMYKWYEDSDATLVYLADVSPDFRDLVRSLWMTRAWTLQEALAPKRIIFYDQNWKLYRGIISDNHKNPGEVLDELARAISIPRETLVSFDPDYLGVREKLRLASTRNATVEEDSAYSLIGIFKSDIIPQYGEKEAALGHLLEGIVAHLGDVTVLAWIGNPSSYNSCLPSTLSVYTGMPYTPPTLGPGDMQPRMTRLLTVLSRDDAISTYQQIKGLPPARFANRRLQLPCIVFPVESLKVKGWADEGNHYRVKALGLRTAEFTTASRLPLQDPQKLVLVHPWISDIRGLQDSVINGPSSHVDVDSGTDEESDSGAASPLDATTSAPRVDDYTLALRTIVRLQQPFNALLLLRQHGGEYYKRVAAENKIVVQVSENHVKLNTTVLDVL